jgi:hypothetical protein
MSAQPVVCLSALKGRTSYAPLVGVGHYVRAHGILAPLLTEVEFTRRASVHAPMETLVDLWLSMLVGCRSVAQVNSKLRPDRTLAVGWGRRHGFAEQSTIARVLDSMCHSQVEQLRQAVTVISRQIGASRQHDWSSPLLVDIDLTELPAGVQAAGSTKGYFQEKGGAGASCAAWG